MVIIAVLAYGFAETYWIRVKEYAFTDPDLPAAFDGTRIVLLTDIHRGPFFSQARVAALVERVNALEPDLLVLGGDYVFTDTGYAQSCFAELKNLRAPLGCFAVLGNHDYEEYGGDIGDPSPVIEAIAGAGITLLREDGVWIEHEGTRIRIGGVSDYTEDFPVLAPTLEGTSEDDFVLLVSHNPDFAETLPAGAVDLVLAGHTHGGQVTFFGLWAPYLPSEYGQKYRTGVVVTENTTVIVSNGIGTSTILPIRLFARPQIVVITLESDTARDAGGLAGDAGEAAEAASGAAGDALP
jgi:predicted MPP superfamily phosphohydrolase